jgi:hypothetical protein
MVQHHNPGGAAVTVPALLERAIENHDGLRVNWREYDEIPNGEWPRGQCPTVVLPRDLIVEQPAHACPGGVSSLFE